MRTTGRRFPVKPSAPSRGAVPPGPASEMDQSGGHLLAPVDAVALAAGWQVPGWYTELKTHGRPRPSAAARGWQPRPPRPSSPASMPGNGPSTSDHRTRTAGPLPFRPPHLRCLGSTPHRPHSQAVRPPLGPVSEQTCLHQPIPVKRHRPRPNGSQARALLDLPGVQTSARLEVDDAPLRRLNPSSAGSAVAYRKGGDPWSIRTGQAPNRLMARFLRLCP
jgi:hypothetical protein